MAILGSWIALTALFAIAIFVSSLHSLFFSTILLALFIFGLVVGGFVTTATYSIPTLIIAGLSFFVIGLLYTVLWYWPRYLKRSNLKQDYNKYKKEYSGATEQDFLKSTYGYEYLPSQNKELIVATTLLWPASFIAVLFGDSLQTIYNTIYSAVGQMLERALIKIMRS